MESRRVFLVALVVVSRIFGIFTPQVTGLGLWCWMSKKCATIPGEIIQFDEHIFQISRNHQPEKHGFWSNSSTTSDGSLGRQMVVNCKGNPRLFQWNLGEGDILWTICPDDSTKKDDASIFDRHATWTSELVTLVVWGWTDYHLARSIPRQVKLNGLTGVNSPSGGSSGSGGRLARLCQKKQTTEPCLEDHPMTCKWLIGPWWSLERPLRIGLDWTPYKWPWKWLINGGDPNYLLSGMILQAPLFCCVGNGEFVASLEMKL